MKLREWQAHVAGNIGFETLRDMHDIGMCARQCECGWEDCPGWAFSWMREMIPGLTLPMGTFGPPHPLLPWAGWDDRKEVMGERS